MKKLIRGLHQFSTKVFAQKKALFESLRNGQHPQAAFITCSDSRINPALVTQSEPGDLFIMRNAGNFIPLYGSALSGEGASLQYAVEVLQVKDVVLCGHSQCGAVDHLLRTKGKPSGLELVDRWVQNGKATLDILAKDYHDLSPDHLLNVAIQENVLVQLEQIRSYPFIKSALKKGHLNLHGWVYKFETGEIFCYDEIRQQFVPLEKRFPLESFRMSK